LKKGKKEFRSRFILANRDGIGVGAVIGSSVVSTDERHLKEYATFKAMDIADLRSWYLNSEVSWHIWFYSRFDSPRILFTSKYAHLSIYMTLVRALLLVLTT